jgi:cyclic pyranopterin phosphate synthase
MSDTPGELTHLSADGAAHMVDVSAKAVTPREAVAEALVALSPTTANAVRSGNAPKGDVFSVARIAGIQAAKETSRLVPLCHPLSIDGVTVNLAWDPAPNGDRVRIVATVQTTGRTGVEMEAITAASVAAITLYDMVKGMDRTVTIGPVFLRAKSGGRSGSYRRDGDPA